MSDFQAVENALAALRRGDIVALLDHPEREGEADLLLAAELATGERVNELIVNGRGLVTLAIAAQRLEELGIPLLQPAHCRDHWPRFAEPVDYNIGTTTGVSAFDRALTAKALTDPAARPEDFARPGHLMPLAASPGGIAQRAGHTEGAVSLALAAELYPAVIMCEMLAPDGHMARGQALLELIAEFGYPAVSVQQVAAYLAARGQA
jgi:3,4-dihydroxy 2-butanone 4-phosphate synthase/GTP cyclohydrolase II